MGLAGGTQKVNRTAHTLVEILVGGAVKAYGEVLKWAAGPG